MKKTVLVLITAMALISCKRQYDLTEQEVTYTLKKFDDSWEKKNMPGVDSVLAPTYVYFTQSGSTFSRGNVVETAGSSDYSLSNMSRSELQISITGSTAIVSTRWKGVGSYFGVPFNEDQRCSVVMVKRAGKVQILSEHCTPIKASRIFH